MAHYLTCPLCGLEFEKVDTLCAHGCPLGALCNCIRCPNCHYEFLERPNKVSWWQRLLGRAAQASDSLPSGVRPLTTLAPGETATVVCLGGNNGSRHNNLAVFGVVPDAEITLLQHEPSCVIRVGETELALDAAIAREVLVRVAEPASA